MESDISVGLIPTLVFVFVTTYTPGPNNILAGSMGAFYGYRRSMPFLFGVAGGFLVIMSCCFALSSMLSALLPALLPILRIAGAVYIVWLAISVYRNSRMLDQPKETEPLKFWNGLILQFVNPKAAIFGLTVFSAFLSPALDNPLRFVYIPVLLTIVAYSAISTWALGGQLIRRILSTPARVRVFGMVLAVALLYTALDVLGVFTWIST